MTRLRSTIIERNLAAHLEAQGSIFKKLSMKSLIGGMVIRVGDTVFDNSVAGRI